MGKRGKDEPGGLKRQRDDDDFQAELSKVALGGEYGDALSKLEFPVLKIAKLAPLNFRICGDRVPAYLQVKIPKSGLLLGTKVSLCYTNTHIPKYLPTYIYTYIHSYVRMRGSP